MISNDNGKPSGDLTADALIRTALGAGPPDELSYVVVSDITCDSRQVRPNSIFVAIDGQSIDGADFATQAADNGALLVVTHRRIENLSLPQIVVSDARSAAAKLAATFYRLDDLLAEKVKLVAITGTNGKTTVSYMLQHICERAGIRCARMGTVEYDLLCEKVTATHTTAEPVQLAAMIRRACDAGARAIAMEVSSHALSQSRVAGLRFATAVFTNLSGDHLDYHRTESEYLSAKLLLFKSLSRSASAVVNIDDKNSQQVISSTDAGVISCSIGRQDADLCGRVTSLSAGGSGFEVEFAGQRAAGEVPFVGKYNVYNALSAIGAAVSIGVNFHDAVRAISTCPAVPGRVERIDHGGDFEVLVDYAHTDGGLDNVLGALRQACEGRLIVVFGCGGDRDRSKRARMAVMAEKWADVIVVTSDNPRTEDPQAIIADILAGFSSEGRAKVAVEADRAAAIRSALAQGRSCDIVLIAGKGHETYQQTGAQQTPFDDREHARDGLRGLGLLDDHVERL